MRGVYFLFAGKAMLISSCFGQCHGRDAIHYVFEKKKKTRSIERFFYFLDSSKGLEIKV